MHHNYQLNALKELRDQQVRYAPREKKIEQSYQAERIYHEISDEKSYSYRFVCVTITDFRAELYPDLMFGGKELKNDLLLFIEDLYDSANVAFDEINEKVWSIEELSKRFNVSEKTISRWRKSGLISRRFLFGHKKRVGFLQRSVDHFLEKEHRRIERGEKFSQLTEAEKKLIIQTARRFSGTSTSPTEVAKRIARYMGRSVETIRYTLKSFDEQNTNLALFPGRHTPLDDETRKKIFMEYRQGMSIKTLASLYHRTRGSIYRIIGQMRAARIAGFALDYIDSPDFHGIIPEKERLFLSPTPTSGSKAMYQGSEVSLPSLSVRTPIFSSKETTATSYDAAKSDLSMVPQFVEVRKEYSDDNGLPPYLAGLYKIPLLTAEQELHLFRKMNYLKFIASKLRDEQDLSRPKSYQISKIEKLYEQIVATKNEIVSANLRLVVSIAKRHVGPYSNFFDLISDGNFSLLRAVNKFDYTRGNRFSTYATWAITRSFARSIPDEKKHRDRYHLDEDDILEKTIDDRSDLQLQEQYQFEREQQVGRLLNELNEREQKIIVSRFGIGHFASPQTLNEVGVEIGVTKERVRQIEARALAKLRKVAEEEHLDIPGLY